MSHFIFHDCSTFKQLLKHRSANFVRLQSRPHNNSCLCRILFWTEIKY